MQHWEGLTGRGDPGASPWVHERLGLRGAGHGWAGAADQQLGGGKTSSRSPRQRPGEWTHPWKRGGGVSQVGTPEVL